MELELSREHDSVRGAPQHPGPYPDRTAKTFSGSPFGERVGSPLRRPV
jgi:hypothetical protein